MRGCTLPSSLFPAPCSLFPIPYSLFPIPYSLFPIPQRRRQWMSGLIHASLPATRQSDSRCDAPSLIFGRRARDTLRFELRDRRVHVVAHEVHLVKFFFLDGVHSQLTRW